MKQTFAMFHCGVFLIQFLYKVRTNLTIIEVKRLVRPCLNLKIVQTNSVRISTYGTNKNLALILTRMGYFLPIRFSNANTVFPNQFCLKISPQASREYLVTWVNIGTKTWQTFSGNESSDFFVCFIS